MCRRNEERLPIWFRALTRGVAGVSEVEVVERRVSSLVRRASISDKRGRTVVREELGSWRGGGVGVRGSWYGVEWRGARYFGRNLEGGSEEREGDWRGSGRVVYFPLGSRDAGGSPLRGRVAEELEGGGEGSKVGDGRRVF